MDAINEIEVKQRVERRQTISDAELLASLMAHKGWGRYMALIESVAQNYHAAMMRPVESVWEMPKAEFAKGVLSGLSLASQMPALKIKEAQDLRPTPADEE